MKKSVLICFSKDNNKKKKKDECPMIYGAGRREERTTSWRELSFCIAALNSSKVTLPSLLASISSNISSSFPGSVMSPGRQSSGSAWAAALASSEQKNKSEQQRKANVWLDF